ncbi:hypothetical protein QR90_06695 [Deinococcus radiopugnans]|uniref:Lipocalin-like domain-containing protein n=1 Tax=Deinococcus radiopugnans TaxID=57497 RepID=A0A0A7KJZ6_9DEIO|nr:hypothetical protein [Deinococcus radiopugnans]AIZ44858.1 hypothetical protein QR90_06695 [Deinococcus radiopugnans]
MKRLLILCTVPLLLAACSGPSTPAVDVNKQQTERLYGTWKFSYTASEGESFNLYTLTSLHASKTPGEYYLTGTDEKGEVVLAGYDSENKEFNLLDQGASFDQFFVFSLTSETTAEGCNFRVNPANGDFSECYMMTGTRTGTAAALSVSKSAAQERMLPPSATNGSAVLQKYRSLKTLAN